MGIDLPIQLLATPEIGGILLVLPILACLVTLIIFVRRYDWKNGAAALVFICALLNPIRLIFQWWLNPILFGLVTVVCLLLLVRYIRQYYWKNYLLALLIICTLLAGGQTLQSTLEVGHCGIEDIRWTRYFYCEPTTQGYQQIESLPIGMAGYCYYCPWYQGVER